MNNEKIVGKVMNKVKIIEKEVSKNYLGQLSQTNQKRFEKDVVGRILAELDEIYQNYEESED